MKCFYCNSKNVKEEDGWFECLDCQSWFDINEYHAIFVLDIRFKSPTDDREEIAWEIYPNGEPELMGIFKEGCEANIKLNWEEVK